MREIAENPFLNSLESATTAYGAYLNFVRDTLYLNDEPFSLALRTQALCTLLFFLCFKH